jgi:preprotein translocase subunit YajC
MTDGLGALLLPAMIIILLGFMFWSQRRRQTAIATLQDSLAVGDDVCTTSGLFGRIVALDEVVATLEVAPGMPVRFDRRAVATKVDTTGRPLGSGTPDGAGAVDPSDAPRPDTEK